ncbi:hypothetical protein C3747_22g317 [Trypanosoma cruzi]|uniref:Uncharacterized protein n=2 Tax=Trypanosoma cruzi TaxID=5693 RepID=Q4DVG5_TRYCC|nr:hypothetical protein, conserved [Trypanosoma cruzi]EAN96512.1 hypothetical protein, conserved [Trypanosoma cruzi]KAF8295533.1 class I transcription factor A, subunit 7 [Trypanosoma cruzi]PWV16600.1 hypothetical protein C3747_22g317 [Trypanosoma cruzi]RNC57717.1 hypothetical protein TcCL_ESM04676 [Trypanosoma cruzi]|eukprot:XP_818363.1 hypothetical protein [Trypanosoma cruzi strain CL Brener]
MPNVRRCRWDHKTLPYVPERPCLLYYIIPGDTVPRVAVPNARGEYPHLIPGMPYLESEEVSEEEAWGCARDDQVALPVMEFAPPPIQTDAATQVEWNQLPVPPLAHLQRFAAPPRQEGNELSSE